MIDLTNQHEIEVRLGRPLSAAELDRMPSTIRDVSAYLRSYAPRIPNSLPLPDAVIGTASWLSISVLTTDPESIGGGGISSEALGGYQVSYREGGGTGLSLTQQQITALKPWMKSRFGVVQIDAINAVAST